ncbi:MAG: uridine kinase family protein [Nocardioides sp.]
MGSPSEVDAPGVVALVHGRAPTLADGRLLCLDGPAGSGKTTLAGAVSALTPATVIHLDDVYDGWSGLPRLATQLDTLLLPLAEGRPGSYRRYDWHADAYTETVTVEPAALLVVEGVGAGMAAYAHLRTALVWIEAPTDIRLARWRARDGAEVEAYIASWERDQEALFEREHTRDAADVIWRTVR